MPKLVSREETFESLGVILASGSLVFGTKADPDTAQTVYSDEAQTVSLGSTVSLNASGQPESSGSPVDIYGPVSSMKVRDSASVVKLTVSNVGLNGGGSQNVTNLAAAKATNLADGHVIETLGYTTAGDGGHLTYRYDASGAETANDGTIITPDSGIGRLKALTSGYVNVMWFGAQNDNSTDITARLQAAHDWFNNAAVQLDGGMIYIPKGQWVCGNVTITNATKIVGDGTVTRLELASSADAYMFTCTNTLYMYDVFIDANRTAQTTGASSGCVDLQDGSDFSAFYNCQFRAAEEYGVKISGPNQIGFSSCQFRDCTDAGAHVQNAVAVTFINGCVFEDNISKGLWVAGTTSQVGVLVQGCYLENNGVYHVYCDAFQSDQYGNTGNSDVAILDNYMNGAQSKTTHYGIYFAGVTVHGARVHGNTFLDCDLGAFDIGTISGSRGLNDLRNNTYTGDTIEISSGSTNMQGFMRDSTREVFIETQEFDFSGGAMTEVLLSLPGTSEIRIIGVAIHYIEASAGAGTTTLGIGITGSGTAYLNYTTLVSQAANTITDITSSLVGYNATSQPWGGGQATGGKALVASVGAASGAAGTARLSIRAIIH